ncbi:telomere-associated protein 1-like protein [Elsinoe fawcettii]|nr:telomere-associated protein 1-like protein [Elsinoe fawcettii]
MNNHQSNFQPTSLDFINRPNPVEPSNVNHGNESSSSHQLESRTNGELLRVLRDSRLHKSSRDVAKELGVSHPQNSQPVHTSAVPVTNTTVQEDDSPSSDGVAYMLPRELGTARYTLPPPAQQGVKRPRHQVPPVLQGLHQPPPNAGLLPSIDAENRRPAQHNQQIGHETSTQTENFSQTAEGESKTVVIEVPANVLPRPTRRNKWTDEETHALLQGVRKFGAGNWKKILTCSDFSFNHRTATDLKDRFRVVCSNKDMLMHYRIYAEYMKNPPVLTQETHLAAAAPAQPGEESTMVSPTAELDLPRAKRRQRTKWSEEEDAALLRGFGRYGPSWTSIQLDPVLKKRTPTDIRDRIRTRFSAEYQKAGLAPKPSKPRAQMRSQPKPTAADRTSNASLPKLSIAPAPPPEQGPQTTSSVVRPTPNSASVPIEEAWYPETPGHMDSSHPLAHLLNSSNNFSLPSLAPLLPRLGPTEHDNHNYNVSTQSINPLATVLAKPGRVSSMSTGMNTN